MIDQKGGLKVRKLILALMLSVFVLGLGATSAMADSIMFPWVVKNTNVTTLISVVQTSEITATCRQNGQNAARLHYQYWYKPACHPSSPAGTCVPNLTGSCEEHDIFVPTSQNDIVSFDAAGNMANGQPVFNDYPGHNSIVDYGVNVDFSLRNVIASTARAFLLVDNNNTVCFEDEDQASMYGEAIVFELNNGAGWGYVAYNGIGGGTNGPNNEPTLGFMDNADLQGEVLRSPRWADDTSTDEGEELEATPTVLLPLSEFRTKIFMTPINYATTEMLIDPPTYNGDLILGARNGTSNARLQFCTGPDTAGDYPRPDNCGTLDQRFGDACQSNSDPICQDGGIWDNDEVIISCQTCRVNVVCTAALDINAAASSINGPSETQLLNSSQITYLTTYGGQAWTYVRSMVGSFWPADGFGIRNPATMSDMIVGKLEFTEGPESVSGTTIGGEINDFKWIRNSGSQWDENWDMLRGINQVIQSDGFGD
jgi:hypothetical protein